MTWHTRLVAWCGDWRLACWHCPVVASSQRPRSSEKWLASNASVRGRHSLAGTVPHLFPSGRRTTTRHRLNRGGNRQVNAALHRVAITQWRGVGLGQPYVQRRMEAGNTKTEALRLLRRRISDEVYRRLLADEGRIQAPANPSHRAA